MRLLCVAAALTLPICPSLAQASTIYSYTGQDYTSATVPYTTTESVTGSFTLSTPLAANLQDGSVTPAAFSFSDGVQTLTDTTALSYSFGDLSTDSIGNITSYDIQINNLTDGFMKLSGVGGGLSGDTVRLTLGDSGNNTVAGKFSTNGDTMTVTPEPSSIALFGTGLLGLAGVMKRRFA